MTGDEALAAIQRIQIFMHGLRGMALTMRNRTIADTILAIVDNMDRVIKGKQS